MRSLSAPLFRWFKASLPTMSLTEQEAIEAGDIWWEAELFRGSPAWDQLLAYPKSQLTDAELAFLKGPVETLCAMIDDWTVSHKSLDLSESVWRFLKEQGFLGIIIPKEYGGLAFSALAHSTIVQKIATHSITAAISTMVPNSLGPSELLLHYGSEAQKNYYLPRLASGEEIPCFGLTSREAGSDASAILDVGIVCEGEFQGEKILGLKLSWNKRYITLAPIATLLGLALKVSDPEKLLGKTEDLGITLCLIPTTHPGVEVGRRHFPLHQAFLNGPTRGTEVFIPLDWVIGGKDKIGQGWRMLVECLSAGRGISLPALSGATSKLCYRSTGAYARIRTQFNTPIGRFEGVEAGMAKIAGYTYMIEAARLLTVSAVDSGVRPAIVTAIAKYHMTEMARSIINHAMDIHGGRAIMLGPNNYLARCYESIPISITVEGANILTRNLIIFGQGVIRCHPYLQEEMRAMRYPDPEAGLDLFEKVFFEHLRYACKNFVLGFFHGLTAGFFCSAPDGHPEVSGYYRQLGRMSLVLSVFSEIALIVLGGKLKRRERLSARLGDALSHLYLASAVLKYYHDFGNIKDDLPSVQWCMHSALYKIQEALLEFCRNFPHRIVGFCLRIFAFPYGRSYVLPADKLEHQLAAQMMVPSVFRDRLTQHCYRSPDPANPLTHLENTLEQLRGSESAFSKLEDAIKKGIIPRKLRVESKLAQALLTGVLRQDEVELLSKVEEARREALRVDDFSGEQLIRK